MHKRILIVDDDPGICDSLSIIFADEGYSVDKTTDSREAADLIEKNLYDVCLFDYKMKGLNGLDLLRMSKDTNPKCPVFIISGMLNLDDLYNKKGNADLAAGLISKPFDVEALVKRIAAIVK
jgi:DNA-binding NtrC family response regulator